MTQPNLWAEPETTPTPPGLCLYDTRPCPKRGRCEFGPEVAVGACLNRAIRCLTCGRTGVESRNTERARTEER